MIIVKALTTKDGTNDGTVKQSSLTKKEKTLVKKVEEGHSSEAALVKELQTKLEDSEFDSVDLEINSEKGSYLRVASIDGIATEDGETSGTAVVVESTNGHLTELMNEINSVIKAKVDDEDKVSTEAKAKEEVTA